MIVYAKTFHYAFAMCSVSMQVDVGRIHSTLSAVRRSYKRVAGCRLLASKVLTGQQFDHLCEPEPRGLSSRRSLIVQFEISTFRVLRIMVVLELG